MATALILGGGVLPSAGAQQTVDVSPTYDSARPSPSPDATAGPGWSSPERLPVHNDQGIRYVSGGVGEGERTELNALSSQFNLRLLFAMQDSGEYLSAVRVNIQDARGGTILSAESKGPWFFAQLAPGDYTVEASATDQASRQPQRQTVHIEGSGQSRLDFRWR